MKTLTQPYRKPKARGHTITVTHKSIITGVTVADALPKYNAFLEGIGITPRTIIHHGEVVGAFVKALKLADTPIADIDETHVGKWINAKDSRMVSTRKNNLSVLNSFFEYCNAKGWIIGVPSKLIRRIKMENLTHEQKEPKLKVALTDDEVYLLLTKLTAAIGDSKCVLTDAQAKAAKDYFDPEAIAGMEQSIRDLHFWRTAIAISRWSGLRLGDICQLEWACFKQPGVIICHTDKRDKRVSVPIDPELEIWIAGLDKVKHHPLYVFPYQRDVILDPARRSLLSIQFKRMLKRYGIDGAGKSFHSLRYSYCQSQKRKGTDMQEIAKLVGHSSTSTTEHYANGVK